MRAFVWLVIVSCGAPNVAATVTTMTDTTPTPVTASATESASQPFVEQRVTVVGADDDAPCPDAGAGGGA